MSLVPRNHETEICCRKNSTNDADHVRASNIDTNSFVDTSSAYVSTAHVPSGKRAAFSRRVRTLHHPLSGSWRPPAVSILGNPLLDVLQLRVSHVASRPPPTTRACTLHRKPSRTNGQKCMHLRHTQFKYISSICLLLLS